MAKKRKKLLNDLETLGYAFFLSFFDIERHTIKELEDTVKEAKVKNPVVAKEMEAKEELEQRKREEEDQSCMGGE